MSGVLPPQRHYKLTDAVDFLIIGSGASGGVLAHELSQNGFSVLVLEQGPWLTTKDFTHNEYLNWSHSALTNDFRKQPTTFRKTPKDKAVTQPARYLWPHGGRRARPLHGELLALSRD